LKMLKPPNIGIYQWWFTILGKFKSKF
jgi:hypothetical protein